MKFRSFILSLILTLSLFFGAVAQAQEVDPCLGLSADDCAVINGAFGNAFLAAQSFKIDYTVDFAVTGVPEGDITFTHTGSGPVALDLAAAFPLSLGLNTTNAWNSPDGPGSGDVELRIVDGIMYIFDGSAWMGVNLVEAMNNPDLAGQLGVPLPTSPEALDDLSGQLGGAMTPEMMDAVMSLVSVPGFLNYVRNGNTFTFTADLKPVLSAPEFTTALTAIGEAAGDPSIAMLGGIAPMILTTGVITVDQTVNTELNIIDDFRFAVDAEINGAMLDPNMTTPVKLTLVFTFKLSEINGAFDFVAPEGATLIPMGG
jgi:hypothetical protein